MVEFAYNVNTGQIEEVDETLANKTIGTHILIGREDDVYDYCAKLRGEMIRSGFSDVVSKIQSICWLKDGRILVGFGLM